MLRNQEFMFILSSVNAYLARNIYSSIQMKGDNVEIYTSKNI